MNSPFFPEEWKVGIISPIHKKGNTKVVENYRGITLLCTAYKIYAYKIYANILTEKLRIKIEEKGALQETQSGFRRGRETMDNAYILQHVIRELRKKGKRILGFFNRV